MADTSPSQMTGAGGAYDRGCYRRGGSCACGGGVCGKEARATPPSPSTAPDGKLRPRYKADGNRVVREHGGLLAQTYIPAEAVYIANALNEQAERLSSRPAEVDDEGLPPLPAPEFCAGDLESGEPVYTAEQYRQGQRDAVAADRARRGGQS